MLAVILIYIAMLVKLTHPPVLDEGSLRDFCQLLREGHSELGLRILVGIRVVLSICFLPCDLINAVLDLRSFFAGLPGLEPIVIFHASNFQHVFSRVFVISARTSAVVFEVVQKGFRVGSDIAKVDGLSALAQEKKSVEFYSKICISARASDGFKVCKE